MHLTIAYVCVSALALFVALNGRSRAENYDGNLTEYDYNEECSCPSPHLNNTNGTFPKPLGCHYFCNVTLCTAPDGYSCYNLTAQQVRTLTTYPKTSCAVGVCKKGTCVKNGTMEQCFKTP
ncbi:evasin P1243-like [Amblyomma americanum]